MDRHFCYCLADKSNACCYISMHVCMCEVEHVTILCAKMELFETMLSTQGFEMQQAYNN